MKSKYRSKMVDSFKSKLRIFFFQQAFHEHVADYIQRHNLSSLTEEFENFVLDNELADIYATRYYQSNPDDTISYNGNAIMAKTLTDRLKMPIEGHDWYFNTSLLSDSNRSLLKKDAGHSHYPELYDALLKSYEKRFTEIFPFSAFEAMLKIDTCSYCGITKDQIVQLGSNGKLFNKRSDTRGYDLEIDRKIPNLEYSKENCCMSCYWCNNAKTDEFTPSEFKEIARGINAIWNRRFQDSDQHVVFPESSTLWE